MFYSKSYREPVSNAVKILKKQISIYCMSDMQEYIDIGKEDIRLGKIHS